MYCHLFLRGKEACCSDWKDSCTPPLRRDWIYCSGWRDSCTPLRRKEACCSGWRDSCTTLSRKEACCSGWRDSWLHVYYTVQVAYYVIVNSVSFYNPHYLVIYINFHTGQLAIYSVLCVHWSSCSVPWSSPPFCLARHYNAYKYAVPTPGVGMLRGAGVLFGMLEVSLYDLCDKVGSMTTAKYTESRRWILNCVPRMRMLPSWIVTRHTNGVLARRTATYIATSINLYTSTTLASRLNPYFTCRLHHK